MGTTKVGIYRKYHGPVPVDESGKPLPADEWLNGRPFSWAVRWFGTEGERYSRSFDTRKRAERFAEQKQAEVRQDRADPPPNISLEDFFREHRIVMKGNVAPDTLALQLTAIEMLADELGWDTPIWRIRLKDIEMFRAIRLKTGISPASANRELRSLRRVFNLAALRGYLQHGNPCVGIPMLKVGAKRPAYVAPANFSAIYEKAKDALWRAMLTTFYSTGIRLREALNLTWGDLDFDGGSLHVTRKTAKGFVQAWTSKDHELRAVPLPEQTAGLLKALQTVAPQDCPYVFMDHGRWDFYRPLVERKKWRAGSDTVNNVLRKFKTMCRQAKVGHYTVHDLRRSCITNWAKRLPIHVVQQLAGHGDISTTRQYYLSVQAEDVKKAQEVQDAVLGPVPRENLTDPKLTHSTRKRVFPGRRGVTAKKKPLKNRGF